MADRVQIPAYTDRWMMGDRYGEITRIDRHIVAVKGDRITEGVEMATVRLDSGKRIRVILNDCTMV